MRLSWIESAGGPLVLVPEAVLEQWTGIKPSLKRAEGMSDYDRACAVVDFIGIVLLDGSEVVVLGDEPLRTTYFWRSGEVVLVRWVYAPNEAAVIRALDADPPLEVAERALEFTLSSDGVRLFDAAEPGNEILGESLKVSLAHGTYRLESGFNTYSDDLRLLIHRFVNVTG